MPQAMKAHSVDLTPRFDRDEDKELDLVRRLLTEAIDESGEKDEYIAKCIGVDPGYFSKMKSGEKPWALRHVVKLPDHVENIFKKKYAETCPGAMVIQPVSEEEARRQLATGLISLLTPRRLQAAKAGLR